MKRGTVAYIKIANYELASFYSRSDQRRGESCKLVRKTYGIKSLINLVEPTQFYFEY